MLGLIKNSITPILYLVTDQTGISTQQMLERVELAIQGGVDVVQLRDKHADTEQFTHTARQLLEITNKYNVPLIINDNINIARQLGLGLHVGINDFESEQDLIDITSHTVKQSSELGFSIATADDLKYIPYHATYLGTGPIFHTNSKSDATPPMGLNALAKLCSDTPHLSHIAIGGALHLKMQV